jgi:hypothetical protein
LIGYAVATVAGAALTYNLTIKAGAFDQLRSLEFFIALGTVGAQVGALVAVRRFAGGTEGAGRRVEVSGWVTCLLFAVVLAGSVTLTLLAGRWYDRRRPHQIQRGPCWFRDGHGNVVCQAGRPRGGEW